MTAYTQDQIESELAKSEGWEFLKETTEIRKHYKFKGYYQTVLFFNSVAWKAQMQKHHPDVTIGFGKCEVRLTTHDVNGISEKDFTLARSIDELYQESQS